MYPVFMGIMCSSYTGELNPTAIAFDTGNDSTFRAFGYDTTFFKATVLISTLRVKLEVCIENNHIMFVHCFFFREVIILWNPIKVTF